MTPRKILRSTFAFVAAIVLSATAHAQLFRSYLARAGSDSNPCTLSAPCRLLPAALNAVANGGEIWMLDSANYNNAPVNISKSVTILAVPGALGSVVATGAGNAIDINTAGVKVALRNLVVVPLVGGGVHGIVMTAGAVLTVENCLIANLPGLGILVTAAATVRVADTTIRDNGGSGLMLQDGANGTVTRVTILGNGNWGVYVFGNSAGTTTTAGVTDSTLDGNGFDGVAADSRNATATVKVSVRNSLVSRNEGGLVAISTEGAPVTLTASNNVISNNSASGIVATAGTKVLASANTVTDNFYGLANTGVFEGAGNNAVSNNTNPNLGTITTIVTP